MASARQTRAAADAAGKAALFLLGACAAVIALGAVSVIGGLIALTVVTTDCRPPSGAQLARQQDFVLAHLPDADDLDPGHMDCDDDSRGYVEFTTASTPAESAGQFLSDTACAPATDAAGYDAAVDCVSDGVTVFISFDASKRRTQGYLSMRPL